MNQHCVYIYQMTITKTLKKITPQNRRAYFLGVFFLFFKYISPALEELLFDIVWRPASLGEQC